MNIIWKRPDNSVAVTHLVASTDPHAHAVELQQRGVIPADWVAVGFNQPIPTDRTNRNAWESA